MTANSLHAELVSAAERFAEQIADDLGIRASCSTASAVVVGLTERYGGNVFIVKFLDEEFAGLHLPGIEVASSSIIAVASCLNPKARATVLLHELVHRLLYSDAYEVFNEAQHRTNGWDRQQFQEEVCRAVERIWVRHGGFDFRKSRRRQKRR